LHGAVPQRITPLDPNGFGRQLHYVQDDSNGQRKPELKSFYEAVVKTLQGAEAILIFGSGTGASSAMTHLVAEMRRRHGRTGAAHCWRGGDRSATPERRQLLARARDFYAEMAPPGTAHSPSRKQDRPDDHASLTMAQQVAQAVGAFHQKTTGHVSKAVTAF